MNKVGQTGQDLSGFFKDVILARRDRQDERLDEAAKAGVDAKSRENLAKLDKKNDDLIAKALADGAISRDEYQKIMRALDGQNAQVEKLVSRKLKGEAEPRPKGAGQAVEDQEQAVLQLQSGMKRIKKLVQDALEGGKLSDQQEEKLHKALEKSQDLLDKALEDGSVSKGEMASVSAHVKVLDRQVGAYIRNRKVIPLNAQDMRATLDSAV